MDHTKYRDLENIHDSNHPGTMVMVLIAHPLGIMAFSSSKLLLIEAHLEPSKLYGPQSSPIAIKPPLVCGSEVNLS